MHDTALEIGQLAIEMYAKNGARILEIASTDVSDSLKRLAPNNCSYMRVAPELGKGIDRVFDAGKPLPFEDETFDLVIVSSVFGQDPVFWETFLDLARLTCKGGHIYINSPSNGSILRRPEDIWRFYPDAGKALERWAGSRDLSVFLIESFIARRKNDHWNDFVAVFRRGVKPKTPPKRFLHTASDGENVWTLGAEVIQKPVAATEDMRLLKLERQRTSDLAEEIIMKDAQINAAQNEAARSSEQIKELDEEIMTQTQRAAKAELELHVAKNALVQREQEVFQVRSEFQAFEAKKERESFRLLEDLAKAKSQRKKARKRSDKLERDISSFQDSFQKAQYEAREALEALESAESSIAQRFDEIAKMSGFLAEADTKVYEAKQSIIDQANKREWLSQVYFLLAEMPFWLGLLPATMRQKFRLKKLLKAGLFDGNKYLELYPDVAGEGMDPLRHYILHGIDEDRERPN